MSGILPRLRLALVALTCGLLPGCFIPNGGWTLRSGFDLRTYKKPSCFLEMVDTRWDEWNRIAEINAMQGACDPSVAAQPGYSHTAAPPPHPAESEPLQDLPDLEGVPPPAAENADDRQASVPAGAWMFR